MLGRLINTIAVATAGSAFILASPVLAQDQASQASSAPTDEAGEGPSAEEISLRQELKAAQARITTLEQRLEALETGVTLNGAIRVPEWRQSEIRGKGSIGSYTTRTYSDGRVAMIPQSQAGGATIQPVEEEGQEGEEGGDRKTPAPAQSVQAVTRKEQGYFGDRLNFEVGMGYSHFDDARINLSGFLALDAIFLGTISIDEITADVIGYDFTLRYGITDRLQVDVSVPYLLRQSNFQSGGAGNNASGAVEATVRDTGLGDINAGVSYRVKKETVGFPDVVFNVRGRFPTGRHPFGVELRDVPGSGGNLAIPETLATGSGVYGISAGLSVLKTLDPMVVFASLTYFYNFERAFDDVDEATGDQPGRIKIGDSVQYGAGVAFALNERSSLSLSFSQRIVNRTMLERANRPNRAIVGSQANVGILDIGANFAITDRLSILTTIGIGMTSDSPDMVLGVRVPFGF